MIGGDDAESKREDVLERVRRQGGFAYAAQVAAACSTSSKGKSSGDDDDDDRGRHWAAEVSHEMAWEQLHAGPWQSVHPAWRDAYSLSCLLLAPSLQPSDALRVLDMGLLLGGPLFKPDLDSAISAFSFSSSLHNHPQGPGHCNQSLSSGQSLSPASIGDASSQEAVLKLPCKSFHSLALPRRALLSVEDFICEFFVPCTPVIIRNAMTHWPALKRWKDLDYLREAFGNRTVPVEIGEHYLAPGWKQELMTMLEFLKKLESPEFAPSKRAYLAQHPLFDQIPKLQEDILIPDYCAATGGEIQSINAWIGPLGTVTPAHQDPHHNLLAQVSGQKYVRLYTPDSSRGLYPYSESMLSNSSQVDLDAPDDTKFPLTANLPFWDCILEEGEMLYIPPKWWHYVKSLSVSFSVSFWWSVA